MSKPIFMSPEHVELMNAALATDAASKDACKKLSRKYQVTYDMDDDQGGKVWWTMSFEKDAGVRFHLAPPEGEKADITFSGSYWKMIDFTERSKAGTASPTDLPLKFGGNPLAYAAIMGAFAAAQQAASVDAEFPRKP